LGLAGTRGEDARALELFPVGVQTLDALHLASLTFLQEQGQRVTLATYDGSTGLRRGGTRFPDHGAVAGRRDRRHHELRQRLPYRTGDSELEEMSSHGEYEDPVCSCGLLGMSAR